MAWADNFNKLIEMEFPIDEKKEWKLALEEHKNKGTLHVNIRAFNIAGNYVGPTKNGINMAINSKEELEDFQSKLNEFFDKAKEML